MQSKWRAPACYVGVAIICAIYLAVVPGVSITDIAAGAGLGAAVMWAINEWETGKWNVPVPGAAAVVAATPAAAATPATAAATAPAEPAANAAAAELEPRQRVDSGVATPESLAKWEVDEKEPSWDPTALAETWAKLRRELSLNRPSRPAVAPDLPRNAQLARGPVATGAAGKAPSGRTSAPAPHSGSGVGAGQASKAPLGSLSKTYAANQRPAGTAGYTSGGAGTAGKPSYGTGHPGTSSSGSSSAPPRKVAGAGDPPRPSLSFLRPR